MQQRSRWSIAAVLTAFFVFLGLIASSPAAIAAASLPSPPTITMVGSPDQSIPARPQFFQLSPQAGETGFTVLGYDTETTSDTSLATGNLGSGGTDAAGRGGVYTGDGSIVQYIRARLNVTLSDGTPYTTGWSQWVKVQPAASSPTNAAPRTVVLGDSFSSGEGVPPFESGSDIAKPNNKRNLCHRSTNAYARVLQRDGKIDLTAFVACSGATTQNVLNTRQYPSQPIQALSITKDTQLVVLTIGGNDIGFGDLAAACATIGCATQTASVETKMIWLRKVLLPRLYNAINARKSSSTKVIVLGYPQVLPDPNVVDISRCAAIGIRPFERISSGEALILRQITTRLNGMIESAAKEAGFSYVDPSRSFAGHELCTKDPYFNRLQGGQLKTYSLHPTSVGQRAYANLVAATLPSAS